jgi:hypothetical protein
LFEAQQVLVRKFPRHQYLTRGLRWLYNVSDHSNLVPNADGSVDIYLQNAAPAGHEANWLPAPTGNFILWLRVYLPGQTILDGEYQVPPVAEVK